MFNMSFLIGRFKSKNRSFGMIMIKIINIYNKDRLIFILTNV